MSSIEKLIKRFKQVPSDFKYSELLRLMKHFEYYELNKGRTSGSRVSFYRSRDKSKLNGHKPHGSSPVKQSFLKQIQEYLISKGDLKDE